ncbi:hypothetical protein [Nocardia sp. alder85J]|uniref:hypothetical protein n=1 Tax=Nocardia sp. alder85J TaxID=2862949 RepID=UPI001CD76B33|nr:hypothetical protein [Nocardia sp. alder85J]MCX4092445.1 hypothetical protein [Nocardia sp. alder85J]
MNIRYLSGCIAAVPALVAVLARFGAVPAVVPLAVMGAAGTTLLPVVLWRPNPVATNRCRQEVTGRAA